MMIKRLVYIFLFLSCSSAIGQNTLSATEAVMIALSNNYQVQIASKQSEISSMNNTWGEAGLFPTVTLSAGNNNTLQDNTKNDAPFTFPGIILSQSINPSLGASWNIFSGFAVKISKTRLEQLEEQSANNAMAVIETTIQDVLKAYYTAQLQNQRKELFKSVMDLSRERFQYYQIKEKYSTSNSLELLQFRNQYLTDSTNYLLQDISYQNSIRNLSILLNDSSIINNEFVLTDQLDLAVKEVDFSDARNDMLENNQNLKNQFINLELQKTNTAFQRSFLYPILSLQMGVNTGKSRIQEIKYNSLDVKSTSLSYYGNLNLRYTIYNNWKTKRAIEVSKIQEEIATMNIESMTQTLTATLTNLVDLYKARVQLVDISQENVEYAKQAFELAQQRFEMGTINSIELATFQNTYQNTMIQHYENLYNKLDTYLEIYKMTGKISLQYQAN